MTKSYSKNRNIRRIQRFLRVVELKKPDKRKQLVEKYLINLTTENPEDIQNYYHEALKRNYHRRRTQQIIISILFVLLILCVIFLCYSYFVRQQKVIDIQSEEIESLISNLFIVESEKISLTEEIVENKSIIIAQETEKNYLKSVVLHELDTGIFDGGTDSILKSKLENEELIAIAELTPPAGEGCSSIINCSGEYSGITLLHPFYCVRPTIVTWTFTESFTPGRYEILIEYFKDNPTLSSNFYFSGNNQSVPISLISSELNASNGSGWFSLGAIEITEENPEISSLSVGLEIPNDIVEDIKLKSLLVFSVD